MAKAKKSDLDKKAIRILVGCVVFIIALCAMYGMARRSLGVVDPDTLCRKDKPLSDHTIILIDRTDPLPDHIANTIFREINQIKDTLPKYAMLSIYQINSESAEVMAPEFCLCNPGNGDDESFLYKNPKQIRARWEMQFGEPLSESLKALREIGRSDTSPIFEAISVIGDLPNFIGATGVRKLVIYSDMLQNMPWCTHYHLRDRQESHLEELEQIITGMVGVDIIIRYIERPSSAVIQGPDHQQLWKDTLYKLGARSVEIKRIVG